MLCFNSLSGVLLLFILWLIITVTWDGLQCVIVVFLVHTHILFEKKENNLLSLGPG